MTFGRFFPVVACLWLQVEALRDRGISQLAITTTSKQNPTSASHLTGIPPPCTQPSLAHVNPGFEDGTFNGWEVSKNRISIAEIVSPGAYGKSNYAANITMLHAIGGTELNIPPVFTCPERLFLLEFDYKFPTTSIYGCYLSLPEGNTYPAVAGDWTHAAVEIRSDFTSEIIPEFDLQCPGRYGPPFSVLLDNYNLTQLPGSVEPSGCPREVFIANGGFDYGNLSHWVVGDHSPNTKQSLVSPGHGTNSKHMLQIDFHKTANPSETLFEIKRTVQNFCPAYNYTYSFDYRFQNYDVINHRKFCSLFFGDGNCILPGQFQGTDQEFQPTNEWTHVEYTCLMPYYRVEYLFVYVSCGTQDGTIPLYNYSDFSVQIDNIAAKFLPPT